MAQAVHMFEACCRVQCEARSDTKSYDSSDEESSDADLLEEEQVHMLRFLDAAVRTLVQIQSAALRFCRPQRWSMRRLAWQNTEEVTAAEVLRGRDIQGIPWQLLQTTRERYRQTRLRQYQNYENLGNSHDRIDQVIRCGFLSATRQNPL